MQPEDASFSQRVFHIVAAIPYGKVTTYGEVARLAGSPRACVRSAACCGVAGRQHAAVAPRNQPARANLATGEDFQRQRQALLAEGIIFGPHSTVDFDRYGWRW